MYNSSLEYREVGKSTHEFPIKNLKRTFSRQHTPELRTQTANEIREYRSLSRKKWNQIDEKYLEINGIIDGYKELKKNILGKLFKTKEFTGNLKKHKENLKKVVYKDISSVRDNFDDSLKEIFYNIPLNKKEQELYLGKDVLKNMSLEDYKWLLTRLSGDYVSHVTRYGIRENVLHDTGGGHTYGEGTFFNTFKELLADGSLNSKIEVFKKHPEKLEEKFKFFMEEVVSDVNGKSNEYILSDFVKKLFFGFKTADSETIHTAKGGIASCYYGSEKGYDFVLVFPVEVIANNFPHQGLTPGGRASLFGVDKWNDYGVYDDGGGIPLELGIVLIPNDVLVDPLTGSQYVLDEKGRPIRDESGGYKRADPKNAITSEQYWENYFTKNPQNRPNKICYYKSGSLSGNLIHGLYSFGLSKFPSEEKIEAYKELMEKKIFTQEEDIPNYHIKHEKNRKDITELANDRLLNLVEEKRNHSRSVQVIGD